MDRETGKRNWRVSAGAGTVFAVLLLSLWQKGLFYDRDTHLLSLFLFLISFIVILYTRKVRMTLPLLITAIVSVCYAITLMLHPASTYGTEMQLIRWVMYGAWVILLTALLDGQRGGRGFRMVLAGTAVVGLISSVSALAMLYDYLPYNSGVMTSQDAQLSALGFRLSGLVQYPNTLGVIAGAFALLHLHGITAGKTLRDRVLAAMPLLPHLTVLGLTESRGAWFAFAVVWAAGYLSARGRRTVYLLHSAWFTCWALAAVASTASLWLSESSLVPLPVIVAWAGSIGLYMLLERLRYRRRAYVTGYVLIMAALLSWGAMMMPSGAANRVTDHYETAGARTLFYKDAWALWQRSPWLGAGGDAWRQQFASMQSEPYVGKEVHSSVFDFLLDIGVVGTLPVLTLAALALVLAWRRHAGLGMAGALIMLHSAIDFDLAYGFITLLLLLFLTLGTDAHGVAVPRDEPRRGGPLGRPGARRRRLAALALAAPLAAVAVLVSCHLAAQHFASTAAGATAQLHSALRLTPADTALRIAVARRLPPQEAAALLAVGLRYERDGKALYRELALASERRGRAEEAAAYWKAAADSDRFDRVLQTEAVERLAAAARTASLQGDRQTAGLLANAAAERFRSYEADVRRVEAMPHPANGKRFAMTEEAKRAFASIYSLMSEPPAN
ncbi:O-antigen ligase family protein [Paenibacillus profundus]|uniref:O-antigen ligase family protein n=1 Tax=Paenibacillus profundus TaxID=1173085 RepID=A0ABS8YJ25_9BACL|nr:O-antigen ligase family protein [Paenibacillus profundus]MCE5171920.1 O-antigen ligase family protein [Paenibacillus profundus]